MTLIGDDIARDNSGLHFKRRIGWFDRLYGLRDRVLASPRFHRFAAAFPLTRGIARRHERALFDLCAGFVYSQTLLACVRLRLFDILADDPQTADALAPRLGLAPEAAERLLKAAASLRLLSRRAGGRYGLGMLGAALRGDPGIAAMIEHHAHLYADLYDPVALLRGERRDGGLSHYWPYAGAAAPATLSGGEVAAYTTLMAASQPLVAQEVLDAYDFSKHRRLLDLGGGDGAFLSAAAKRAPHLKLVLFDLPSVADRAKQRFAAEGLSGRAQAYGGDFLTGDLPKGADLITLVRILLDHDDENALAILRAARAALDPGGALLLAEPMSGTPGGEPVADAYFGFYLLAMGRGRTRTPGELKTLLHAAGFARAKEIPVRRPLLARVLLATLKARDQV